MEYQFHKYERYLAHRALEYRGNRTEERLEKAEGRREKHISDSVAKDEEYNNNLAFGDTSRTHSYADEALNTKNEFMKAIAKLDEIFGDQFIIDENKIRQALSF